MSAPQVGSAFIDLFASQTEPKAIATYGELEKRLYSVGPKNKVGDRRGIIIAGILILILYYLKKR